jgi:glucose/mannose transport system substrate-binding protein
MIRKLMRSRLEIGRVACVALAAAILAPSACSDGATQTSTVEVLHWWKKGGEFGAINALLDLFREQNPSVKIVDASVDGSTLAREAIRYRMGKNSPPDTFQANGGWDLMAWVLYYPFDNSQSKMRPIDEWAQDWMPQVPRSVLDSVSYAGQVYAVPLNIHRVNTLFYNKKVFRDFDIDPAKLDSLDALFAAAEKIKQYNLQLADPAAQHIAPIALGFGEQQTWTLSLVFFENLLVARLGGAGYRDLFVTPKTGDAFTLEMSYAIEDFRRLLGYANNNADAILWDKAMLMVLKGEAAMTIMGDWAKGYAKSQRYDETHYYDETMFGAIPMPGTAGTFVFTTDTFGLPYGANEEDTVKLLKLFGSRDGQDTFNPIKGSISARKDAAIEKYDAMSKQTFDDFLAAEEAKSIVPATSILAQQLYLDAIGEVLGDFADEPAVGSVSKVQHTLDNYADVLRSSCWPTCQP